MDPELYSRVVAWSGLYIQKTYLLLMLVKGGPINRMGGELVRLRGLSKTPLNKAGGGHYLIIQLSSSTVVISSNQMILIDVILVQRETSLMSHIFTTVLRITIVKWWVGGYCEYCKLDQMCFYFQQEIVGVDW